MDGRHWGDAPGRRRYGYVPPCRRCGLPCFSGRREKGRGLLCRGCDRRSLREAIDETLAEAGRGTPGGGTHGVA